MRKILSTITAAILSASLATPLAAAPIMKPLAPEAGNLVQNVQYRKWRESRRHNPGDRFERRGNRAYYRGHRGYRHHRPGYREYNGFWFPAAAFLAGSLITGAITSDRNRTYRRGTNSAHVEWCYDRYRSYRATDNTFQPYNGPRRACNSPYN